MPSGGVLPQGRGAQDPTVSESWRDREGKARRLPRFSGAPRSSVAVALREAGGTWHEVGLRSH